MVYIEVRNQEQFDKALQNIEDNQVIVLVDTTQSIVATDVKNTIEVRDGILTAIRCKSVVALNDARVLTYFSVVYGNDNSFILNGRGSSTCLLYDSATSEKLF